MDSTYTITFGEQGENHYGMQIVGHGLVKEGLTCDELKKAQLILEAHGVECELIDLNVGYETPHEACILIARKGVNYLIRDTGKNSNDLLEEQAQLNWDTQAFMYGRVVNKKARYNICYSDEAQEPDYENKKGRIVPFADIPLTQKLREMFPTIIGDKVNNLQAEGNWYYDPSKCGIGFHGDAERKIVIAIRLGQTLPLDYQWFYKNEAVGDRIELSIEHGDVYFMSEKATGNDWKKRNTLTLRHAAGCESFRTIKKKVKK